MRLSVKTMARSAAAICALLLAGCYSIDVATTASLEKSALSPEDGRPVVELDLRLAARPDLTMPYDMAAFVGKTLTLEMSPQVDFEPAFADQPDDAGLYSEKYRPVLKIACCFNKQSMLYVNIKLGKIIDRLTLISEFTKWKI